MEEVVIVTRDINGKRTCHCLQWDSVCSYIIDNESLHDEEILLITAGGVCVYSGLQDGAIEWEDLTGFFA